MPPIQDHNRGKKRPNAATDPVETLAAYFQTDLKNGLSPKVAKDRLTRREDDGLFGLPNGGFWQSIKPLLTEPVMWLLLTICVVALFFHRTEIGLLSAILLIAHSGVCVFLNEKTRRLSGDMQTFDIPLSRVLRNRRLLRVRGDDLVPGDVIMLRRGDVIPADCRLISSYRLAVKEETLFDDDLRREQVVLEKDAHADPETATHRHSPQNMVYAGGVVTRGQGKALVVAVASRTHLGGRVGHVKPTHTPGLPAYLTKLKKILSTINLALCVAVLPLTAIGLLTLKGRYEFLDVFMSALALAVMNLTERVLALGMYRYTAATTAAEEDKDRANTVEIRTPATAEALSYMDHLILMGTAGLHDGIPTPVWLCTSGEMYRVGESEPDLAVKLFAEKLNLLSMGQADLQKGGAWLRFPHVETAAKALTDWAEPDMDAVLLRLERMETHGDTVRLALRDDTLMDICLTEDPAVLDQCAVCRYDHHVMTMDDDMRADWYREAKQAHGKGLRVQFLVTKFSNTCCLEGFMALTVGYCRKTKGCIEGMEASGLTVVSFLRSADAEEIAALHHAGLTARTLPVDLSEETLSVTYSEALQNGVRSFIGCRTEDVLDCIQQLQKSGHRVGLLSVEQMDLPLLQAADIAITCTPHELRDALNHATPTVDSILGGVADGCPDSPCAADLCRRNAHVVVRRCNAQGGGVCGIRRGIYAARQLTRGTLASVRFVLLSQCLRALLVLLPFLLTAACLPAPVLLMSGLLLDLLAVLCYAGSDVRRDLTEKDPIPLPDSLKQMGMTFMAELILTATSAVISSVLALVTYLVKGSDFGDMAYYLSLSLVATQLMIFATGHMPRKGRRGFFTLIFMVCGYVGLLSVALASGLQVLYCLLLPLISPLLWLIGYGICRGAKILKYHH